jgi:hypothetical protein
MGNSGEVTAKQCLRHGAFVVSAILSPKHLIELREGVLRSHMSMMQFGYPQRHDAGVRF